MAILRFQRPCTDIMILIITTLPPLLFGYPVILNITQGPLSATIGLGDKYGYSFGEDFKSCICRYRLNPCYMPSDKVDTYTDPLTQAMSAENVDNYRTDAHFFLCKYNFTFQNVRCYRDNESSSCPSMHCTIKIIIACPDGKTGVLEWASEQKPRVMSFKESRVIDCCITSSNLTQLTIIPTTPTTTFSTHPTTDATTTTLKTFNGTSTVGILQSSSPTPDVMTISSTHSGTTNEQNGTNFESAQISSITSSNLTQLTTIPTTHTTTIFKSTHTTTDATTTTLETFNGTSTAGIVQSSSPTPGAITISSIDSGTSNEQNGTNDESSQISSQQIGLFMGSTVVSIMVTLAIVCIYLRLKSRRENNQRNKSLDSTGVSGNVQKRSVDNLPHDANVGDKDSRTIALISPLVRFGERESHLVQPAGDYTYIDYTYIYYTYIDVSSTTTSTYDTDLTFPSHDVEEPNENSTEIQDSEYSHLRTNKVRQENPYDLLEEEILSTIIRPVSISSLLVSTQQLNHNLQTPYPYLIYDYPITEPSVTQQIETSKPNSEIRSMTTTALLNHKLQSLPHAEKHKRVEIAEGALGTHDEVILKTTREKSINSNQVKKTNNQEILTKSNNDHPILTTSNNDHPILTTSNNDHPILTTSNNDHPILTTSNNGHPVHRAANWTKLVKTNTENADAIDEEGRSYFNIV